VEQVVGRYHEQRIEDFQIRNKHVVGGCEIVLVLAAQRATEEILDFRNDPISYNIWLLTWKTLFLLYYKAACTSTVVFLVVVVNGSPCNHFAQQASLQFTGPSIISLATVQPYTSCLGRCFIL